MAFTFVSSQWATGPTSPITISPVTIGAGHLLVAVAMADGTPTSFSISDGSNTYTAMTAILDGASEGGGGITRLQGFYVLNSGAVSAGTLSLTITGAVGMSFAVLAFYEYSFTAASVTFDFTSNGLGTAAASPMDSGPITTTKTSVLVGWDDYSATIPTLPAGWNDRNPARETQADQLNVAAGTYRFQPTYTGTQDWNAIIASFSETVFVPDEDVWRVPYRPPADPVVTVW